MAEISKEEFRKMLESFQQKNNGTGTISDACIDDLLLRLHDYLNEEQVLHLRALNEEQEAIESINARLGQLKRRVNNIGLIQ